MSRAYKALASRYHPDRPKSGDPALFARLTRAYELISNPVNRALYDLDQGLTPHTPSTLHHIHHLRRTEAMQALRLLFTKTHLITQHEAALPHGLLILHARYGLLSSPPHTLDVTMQLQARVQDSMLLIPHGTAKSWLEGFYDPTEGGVNELEVVYRVGGRVHRVRVGDEEELLVPREADVMTKGEVRRWEREFELRGVDLAEVRRKRMRRYAAVATVAAVVVGGGVWWYGRRGGVKGEGKGEGGGEGGRGVGGWVGRGRVEMMQGWVEGLGGVVGSGGDAVRDVVTQWVAALAELTAQWVAQLPSRERVLTLGQSLVSSVSPEWLGQPSAVPLLNR